VQDLKQHAKLIARKAFLNKLKKEVKELSAFIGPEIVDNKPTNCCFFPDESAKSIYQPCLKNTQCCLGMAMVGHGQLSVGHDQL
jgi:hypothetical protein